MSLAEANPEMPPPRKLLIVGAGASVCCEFPLGKDLIPMLCSGLRELCPALSDSDDGMEQAEGEHQRLARVCRDTTFETIDELLIRRPDLRSAGSLAIAAVLATKQISVAKYRKTHSTWHNTIYKRLFRETELWRRDRSIQAPPEIGMVNFNYDLNVQVGIAIRHHADSGCEPADAWALATQCPIVHVHGALSLDNDIIEVLANDHHKLQVSLESLRGMAKRLALSTDEAKLFNDESLAIARSWVRHASEIMFLGFGFDPCNLNRIGIGAKHSEWASRERRIQATGKGLSTQAMEAAAGHCGRMEFLSSDFSLEGLVTDFLTGVRSAGVQATTFPRL